MLTGDNEHSAYAVANKVGIDKVHAKLLPEDKLSSEQIEDIKKEIFDFKTTKMKDRGYAGVLDASKSRWKTWPLGRLAHMERAAGEEIRKTAEKGLPKKKDE